MIFERYFPWGLAEGESFLGRKAEIAKLNSNLTHGYHSLLLAPRRYGKTSLAKHVIKQLHYPCVEIDLFVAQNEFSIEQKFLKGIQTIISAIDTPEKWFAALANFFKQANKTWTVGIKGLTLELTPENHKDVPENILEALNALEHVLSKKKQRAILFIDEFQEIANVSISRAIEGAIRHFAQASKYVVFIFSGSSKHMLKHIFGDKTRPLYALCDEINLDKLTPNDYHPYLDKVAKKTWNKVLAADVFERIVYLTECHPRYMYHLCLRLWEHCGQLKEPPKVRVVDEIWITMVDNKLKDTRELLAARAMGQIKILSFIALGHGNEMTGQITQAKLGLSGSAIAQALKILQKDDYIEKRDDGLFRMIDPLLKATIAQYGADYFL